MIVFSSYRQLWADRHRRGQRGTLPATWLFLFSFAGLIVVGTLGLLFLPGLYTGPGLGVIDALFTATSAVCVTGLIVVDTATYFTPLGQAWIALLIQLGGLGILTFTTLIVILMGMQASVGMEEAAGSHAAVVRHVDEGALVRAIVLTTLLLEAAGAILLWLAWRDDFGGGGAVWPAVFHAVSAFCNAGFSVFSNSLIGSRGSPAIVLTVAFLVVTGGMGFIVLTDLWARSVTRRADRLSTHTRLALTASGILLVGGTMVFLGLEWRGQLAGLGWLDRITNALFMSVTPRTAGFNTVDYDGLSSSTLFATILLMLIGGSPGSTAGGLKTTTLALLGLALWAHLRGRTVVSAWNRSIPAETVRRAAGVAMAGLSLLALSVLLLSVTELAGSDAANREAFTRLVFEAHSAFGTVGLSMGATGGLSGAGRLIITCLMFVGRVGPLAIASAMALAGASTRVRYRLAHEDVVIG